MIFLSSPLDNKLIKVPEKVVISRSNYLLSQRNILVNNNNNNYIINIPFKVPSQVIEDFVNIASNNYIHKINIDINLLPELLTLLDDLEVTDYIYQRLSMIIYSNYEYYIIMEDYIYNCEEIVGENGCDKFNECLEHVETLNYMRNFIRKDKDLNKYIFPEIRNFTYTNLPNEIKYNKSYIDEYISITSDTKHYLKKDIKTNINIDINYLPIDLYIFYECYNKSTKPLNLLKKYFLYYNMFNIYLEIHKYDTGKVISEKIYEIKGIDDSIKEKLFDNNNIENILKYILKYFNPNRILEEVFYDNNDRMSLLIKYYEGNDKPIKFKSIRYKYEDDDIYETVLYYENKKVSVIINYKNDLLHGSCEIINYQKKPTPEKIRKISI